MASIDILVLRHSGERTLSLCRKMIEEQINAQIELHEICDVSFDLALRRTFELATQRNYRFIYTVDGDTILHPLGIKKLQKIALSLPTNFFSAQGKVVDKVFGTVRPAGQRVYNASLSEKALKFIPEVMGEIRPEASLVKKMGKKRHKYFLSDEIIGVHDFEQFYGDLYRKAFIHTKKHRNETLEHIPRFCQLMKIDDDFRVIMKGVVDGFGSLDRIKIDKTFFEMKLKAVLNELGLTEKALITKDQERKVLDNSLFFQIETAEKNLKKNNLNLRESIKFFFLDQIKILHYFLGRIINYLGR